MGKNYDNDEMEIDLLELFYVLKSKILAILGVGLLFGCIACAYAGFLVKPLYTSSSMMLVLTKETTLNHSVSADRPLNTKTNQQLREELSQQIRGCNAVIVVAGMYTLYSEWINYEIDEALRMKKPIIGIKPWGNQRIPEKIQQNATVLVGWNSSSLVSAVRNYAL